MHLKYSIVRDMLKKKKADELAKCCDIKETASCKALVCICMQEWVFESKDKVEGKW